MIEFNCSLRGERSLNLNMNALLNVSEASPEWLAIVAKQVESLRFGVVQIVVHENRAVQIDKDAFPNFATANSAREARKWGIGMNWHLNRNIKASVNYLNTDFGGGSKAKGEVCMLRVYQSITC